MKTLSVLSLLLLTTSVMAGEADRGHDFRDVREALVRQLSPEGRYCRECHQRKPAFKAENVRPLPPVPLPATALLFGTALGGVVIAKKWRRT